MARKDGLGPPDAGGEHLPIATGGLGLIIASGIAARHEGSLSLRSRQDGARGSQVELVLPRRPVEQQAQDQA